MARAGYCEVCQRYVYLNEQWGCQNGHPWTAIRAWYDPDTGQPITPYWLEPGYAPADATAPVTEQPEAAAAAAAPASAAPAAPEPAASEPGSAVVPVGEGLPVAEPEAPAPEPVAAAEEVPIGQGFPEPEPEAPAPAITVPQPDVPVEQGLPEPEAPGAEPAVAVAAAATAMPAPATESTDAAPTPAAPRDSAAATRLDLLAAILETMARYPGYNAHYGTDTDIVIDNEVADATWPGGKKRVEYSAMMKAVEADRTLYFWEMLSETSSGPTFGAIESTAYTISGTKRSGATKIVVLGTDGAPVEVDWDFGATRQIVESVAVPRGWKVQSVLRQASAKW